MNVRILCIVIPLILITNADFTMASSVSTEGRLKWSELPPLPDRYGFAGMFSGVSDGALILAGGSNIPEEEWGKGTKTWYSDIWVLESNAKEWIRAGKLPHPADTGVSVTTKWGVIMAGGVDGKRGYSCVHLVRWNSAGKKLELVS